MMLPKNWLDKTTNGIIIRKVPILRSDLPLLEYLLAKEIMIGEMTLSLRKWYKTLKSAKGSCLYRSNKKKSKYDPFDVILRKGDLVWLWDKRMPKITITSSFSSMDLLLLMNVWASIVFTLLL